MQTTRRTQRHKCILRFAKRIYRFYRVHVNQEISAFSEKVSESPAGNFSEPLGSDGVAPPEGHILGSEVTATQAVGLSAGVCWTVDRNSRTSGKMGENGEKRGKICLGSRRAIFGEIKPAAASCRLAGSAGGIGPAGSGRQRRQPCNPWRGEGEASPPLTGGRESSTPIIRSQHVCTAPPSPTAARRLGRDAWFW